MAARIPETILEFNAYIGTTDDYLTDGTPTTNGARLGLSTQNITDWSAKRTYWRDTLYPKYQDPLQNTSAVKDAVRNFMSGFHTFGNPLLNIMAASLNATEDDEHVLNFKRGRHQPTHSTTQIADDVKLEAKAMGGGDVHFSCDISGSDQGGKADGADSVQVAYLIQNGNNNPPVPNPNPDLPSPDSTQFIKEISTKTNFTIHFGTDNKTNTVVVAVRWFNTKHPELAGRWCNIQAVVIA